MLTFCSWPISVILSEDVFNAFHSIMCIHCSVMESPVIVNCITALVSSHVLVETGSSCQLMNPSALVKRRFKYGGCLRLTPICVSSSFHLISEQFNIFLVIVREVEGKKLSISRGNTIWPLSCVLKAGNREFLHVGLVKISCGLLSLQFYCAIQLRLKNT